MTRLQVDLSWANLRAPVLVSLPHSLLCFSLSFSSSTFTVGEQLTFKLELSSALPAPLRLSALVARCTDSNFNFLLSAVDVDDRELQLEEEEQVKYRIRIEHELDLVPGSCWKIDCALPASLPASHLGVRNVTLVWGAPPACILLGTEEGARGRGGQEHAEHRETMVMAAKPDAKVAMVCHPPALLGELFPVALRVLSSSSSQLRAGRLKCRVDMTDVQGRAQVQLFAAKATGGQEGGGSELELELPAVDGGEEHVEVLHLKVVEEEAMPSLDVLQLALRAELQHEGDSGKVSRVEQQVEVEVEKPFLLTVLYGALSHADSLLVHQPTADVTPSSSAPSSSSSSFSASSDAASSSPSFVLRGESVIVRVILEALSPAALLLEEASLQLGEKEVRPLSEDVGVQLERGEKHCMLFSFAPMQAGEASPGKLSLRWSRRREVGADRELSSPPAAFIHDLPPLLVKEPRSSSLLPLPPSHSCLSVLAELLVPPAGTMGELMKVRREGGGVGGGRLVVGREGRACEGLSRWIFCYVASRRHVSTWWWRPRPQIASSSPASSPPR